MSFASIMVSADQSEKVEHRYRLARNLSGKFDSRLIGVGARMIDTPPGIYGPTYPIITFDFEQASRDDLSAVHDRFMKAMAGCNKAEWRGSLEDPVTFLAEQSRAADLIIVGSRGKDDAFDRDFGVDPGEIALEAGRPVLIVPPWMNELTGKRVVIAWCDTREARRAVQDSLPFLHRAEEVCVVEVVRSKRDRTSVKDVAKNLTCHGIRATAHHIEDADCPAENALLDHALYMEADLIVSGAYGHSRLKETIFGGVTHGLLKHANVACMMSH